MLIQGDSSVVVRWIASMIVVSATLAAPARAMADRCADLAKPATFDKGTAMAAIFCEYDRAKGGTLLPVEHQARYGSARKGQKTRWKPAPTATRQAPSWSNLATASSASGSKAATSTRDIRTGTPTS